jgi:hypothetical protein
MSAFTPFAAIRLPLVLLVLVLGEAAAAPISNYWKTFAAGGDRSASDVLTDYSYAGYGNGEVAIPDVAGPIFKVVDFGAIPDDALSDEEAIRQAVAAAERAGGGVVLFPPGKFLVWTERTRAASILIQSSGIVIRGAGSSRGGTIIRAVHSGYGIGPFVVPKKTQDFEDIPYVFKFQAPASETKSTTTELTGSVKRGDFRVPVKSTAGFRVGDWINLGAKTLKLNAQLLAGLTPDVTWTRLNDGIQINEKHRIAAVADGSLVLREPVLVDLSEDYEVRVAGTRMIEQVGVEDIAFAGGWRADFLHHRNALDDEGWDALVFDGVADGWVRRCAFINLNSGIYLKKSAACSLIQNRYAGAKGHYNAAVRADSSFNLMGLSTDQSGHLHGVSTGNRSAGTVVWRWKLAYNQSVDSHGNGPYATLIDRVDGGSFTKSGGPAPSFPNHLDGLVFWNFSYAGKDEQPINLYEAKRGTAKYVKPLFIGLHGEPVVLTPEALGGDESRGQTVAPESLYEAQLERRRGKLPAWVDLARREWEYLQRAELPPEAAARPPLADIYPEQFALMGLLQDWAGLMGNQELGWATPIDLKTDAKAETIELVRDYVLLRTVLHQLATYASPRPVKDEKTGAWVTPPPLTVQVQVNAKDISLTLAVAAPDSDREKNQGAMDVASRLAASCQAKLRVDGRELRLIVKR